MSAPHESRRTRAVFGVLVLVSTALAAVAAGAVTWLSERPGLHRRFDLTAAHSNTLAPALAELIEKLPERVYVETFFQPLERPLTEISREAQRRMAELLFIAQNHAPEKLKVIEHDLKDLASAEAAMRELGLGETNVVVVHVGPQRVLLRLLTDIARVDFGNPDPYVPPRMTSFRGEESLARALKRVSRGAPPRILYSEGHAERALRGGEPRELGQLARMLVNDGFEVGTWSFPAGAPLPAECDVLVVVEPKQPFSPDERASIDAFLARGGRLLAVPGAPELDAPGSLVELLASYGIDVGSGYAAAPVAAATGQLFQGYPKCGELYIGAEGLERSHPITEPLWRSKSTVWFSLSRTLALGRLPSGAVAWPLVSTDRNSWLDVPGGREWFLDRDEPRGPLHVCMALELLAPKAPESADEIVKARILVVGTPEALNNLAIVERNAPLLLNAFNWLTSREYRITIPTRTDDKRILEVGGGSNLRVFHTVAVILLPGLCAALGLGLWWWRRR